MTLEMRLLDSMLDSMLQMSRNMKVRSKRVSITSPASLQRCPHPPFPMSSSLSCNKLEHYISQLKNVHYEQINNIVFFSGSGALMEHPDEENGSNRFGFSAANLNFDRILPSGSFAKAAAKAVPNFSASVPKKVSIGGGGGGGARGWLNGWG